MPSPRVLAAAALLAVTGATLPAHAGPPVLDGKAKKALPFTFAVSDPQAHPVAETAGDVDGVDSADGTSCVKPRCFAVPFSVKPAKGVAEKTPLSIRVEWTSRTTRLWLELVDVTSASPTIRGECYSFYVTNGTAATVRVNSVKPGRKYAAWVYVQQAVAPDTVKGTVTFPATATVADNPGPSPTELFANGCNA